MNEINHPELPPRDIERELASDVRIAYFDREYAAETLEKRFLARQSELAPDDDLHFLEALGDAVATTQHWKYATKLYRRWRGEGSENREV
jgi:hypothetical protein